jgi:hypothetical protein
MTVVLSEEQISTLRSMNNYWEEISKRDNVHTLSMSEMLNLMEQIPAIHILLIAGDYAKKYNNGK